MAGEPGVGNGAPGGAAARQGASVSLGIVWRDGVGRRTAARAAGQKVGLRAGVGDAHNRLLVDLFLDGEVVADVLRTAPAIVGVGKVDFSGVAGDIVSGAAGVIVQVVGEVAGEVVVARG